MILRPFEWIQRAITSQCFCHLRLEVIIILLYQDPVLIRETHSTSWLHILHEKLNKSDEGVWKQQNSKQGEYQQHRCQPLFHYSFGACCYNHDDDWVSPGRKPWQKLFLGTLRSQCLCHKITLAHQEECQSI